MTDNQFIRQFESGALAPENFHHQDHVRLAWLYLNRYSLAESLQKFSAGLKQFAKSIGKENLYHETITCAYVFLIHERKARINQGQNWPEFAESNSDLLNWQDNILKTYYREETLKSDFARRVFVLPDKAQDKN